MDSDAVYEVKWILKNEAEAVVTEIVWGNSMKGLRLRGGG
jgi:hypothetical protein